MATNKTTRMDAQGRVIIPPHIRKELNLNAGQKVSVSMNAGIIQIRPAEELCVCCGGPIKDDYIVFHEEMRICKSCALAVAKALQIGAEIE